MTPEIKLRRRTAKELMATGRENDGSDMPRRGAFPHLPPELRGPTPYSLDSSHVDDRHTHIKRATTPEHAL